MTTMLSFVLENVPSDWESVSNYDSSYILFDVQINSTEAKRVKTIFNSLTLNINSIRRVQNPFQYGRFKLRQEMLDNYSVDTVFHIVDKRDLETALKYTCDYRRYKNGSNESMDKHPRFYQDVQSVVSNLFSLVNAVNNSCVLIVKKISGITRTQSDYYIQYVIDFE